MILKQKKFSLHQRLLYLFTGKIQINAHWARGHRVNSHGVLTSTGSFGSGISLVNRLTGEQITELEMDELRNILPKKNKTGSLSECNHLNVEHSFRIINTHCIECGSDWNAWEV